MDFLKELFGDAALTFEQLQAKVAEKGLKLADLSTGNYVDKKKYDDAVETRDTQITELKGQITTRDKDLSALKKQVESGDADSQTKLTELTEKLTKLQGDYDTAKKDYETKLSTQAYEFAVKEYAGGLKFTSEAAKRDFESQLIAKGLKLEDKKIIGADDFMKTYKEANAKAFEEEKEDPGKKDPLPTFIQPPTPGAQGSAPETNPFLAAYGFNIN
jgi:hypothetical protein